MIRTVLPILFLTAACTSASMLGKSKADSGSTPPTQLDEKRPVDSDRPSDSGEGVAGYLIDPAKVQATATNGAVAVQGQAGAVTDASGKPAATSVILAEAPTTAATSEGNSLTATVVATATTQSDGSFQFTGATVPADQSLVVAAQGGSGSVSVPRVLTATGGRTAAVIAMAPAYSSFAPLLQTAAAPAQQPGSSSAPATVQAVQGLWLTQLGLQSTDGSAATCPSGFYGVTTVVDCTGGQCRGTQGLCAEPHGYASDDDVAVVVDAKITAYCAHSPTPPPCDAGYQPVGDIVDCCGGTCSGIQTVCVQTKPFSGLAAGSSYVDSVFLTPAGTHAADGACPAGDQARGNVADCSGGTCQGNQNLCLHFQSR